MVHPYMRQSHHREKGTNTAEEISTKIEEMLDRLHAIVIGPGLGRDSLMQDTAKLIIEAAKKKGMPFVVDADGLFLVQNHPSVVKDYTHAILTPNKAEFERLCKTMNIEPSDGDETEICSKLAKAFGGVTIIQKGPKDYISNGKHTMVCDLKGGLKRSGGQGDTLTGCLVTFLAWKNAYQDRLWKHDNSLSDSELIALSAFGASAMTRNCSRLAYEKNGRALQAFDLSLEVGQAFKNLFESEDPKL
ncbi:H-hydrate dehydratase [Morchella snyderi]|nr:H-hydrate dehydratase [Morchella snyderi]